MGESNTKKVGFSCFSRLLLSSPFDLSKFSQVCDHLLEFLGTRGRESYIEGTMIGCGSLYKVPNNRTRLPNNSNGKKTEGEHHFEDSKCSKLMLRSEYPRTEESGAPSLRNNRLAGCR
mgnify:CR=1 FL=1